MITARVRDPRDATGWVASPADPWGYETLSHGAGDDSSERAILRAPNNAEMQEIQSGVPVPSPTEITRALERNWAQQRMHQSAISTPMTPSRGDRKILARGRK